MAVVAATRTETKQERHIERWVGTSAAATEITLSSGTTPTAPRRLVQVTVSYSAAPTSAATTITLNSGAGSGYDTLLSTGQTNTRYMVYIPDQEITLMSDDAIDVVAASGGGALTCGVAIYTEILGN